jgi:hypothetical protein
MSMIRDWINRDDGDWFRVGNRDLGALEAVGYFVGATGLLVGACRSVLPELPQYLCWVLLLGGCLLALLGECRDETKPKARQPAGAADPAGRGAAQP